MSEAREKCRILIVDDSTVFRSQIRAALTGVPDLEIEIVGSVAHGQFAVDAMKTRAVDVVTLDLEMPVMNGLETLAEMRRLGMNARVIAFSAQTRSGAEATMAALSAGASDFLPKPVLGPEEKRSPAEVIRDALVPKIRQFLRPATSFLPSVTLPPAKESRAATRPNWGLFRPKILTIASSTGGPAALEKLFGMIQGPLRIPVVIAQHMPPLFTATLAERLAKISGLPVAEGKHLQVLEAGHVYIAPGDFHMRVSHFGGSTVLTLDQEAQRNSVRPAADHLFESVAKIYGSQTCGVVLTGMGSDGKDGAIAIKAGGGGVMIQSRESCVVFGMPGAVHEAQAFDRSGDIPALAKELAELGICSFRGEKAA